MTAPVLEAIRPSTKFEDDPLFSVVVPVYDIKTDVLKRCLMSLDSQNYDNLEVILVFDGPNPELKKVADHFLKKNENWKVLEIAHAGACAARNAGFYASNGEIVSFTNSDYILKPGIIRMWVDKLQENKDCGFLYGAYQYTANNWWYPSKPFDTYLLEEANYIDCGFPLWRKNFVPWDVNCKSLQDWDFWLRVVKTHNVKGYYLEDISFIAEPPRPKGLSDDSSSHWIERVKYVKEKNGIPLRDLVVTSLGAPNHGVEIAKMLKASYRDDTIHKPNQFKGVYMIGFYIKPGQNDNQHGPILSRFGSDVKKLVHWVGADIYHLRNFSYSDLKSLGGALKMTATHLVENKTAQEELKDLLGIDAEIVPIPPYNDYEVKPLPEEFKVSVFLTDKSDFDKYLKEHTLSIVRALPFVKFTAYGDAAKDINYPNLECVGNLSKDKWKEYVYANSAYLRIVRHDTVPLANAEFMMAGRSVISNIFNECTHYVNTSGDSEINKWDKFGPGLNAYNWPKTKKSIIQEIMEVKNRWKGYAPDVIPKIQERFSRDTYINKIYSLTKIERPIS